MHALLRVPTDDADDAAPCLSGSCNEVSAELAKTDPQAHRKRQLGLTNQC